MDKNFLQTELEKIIRQFIISSMCNKSFKQNILMLNRPCEKKKKKHTHTHNFISYHLYGVGELEKIYSKLVWKRSRNNYCLLDKVFLQIKLKK